MGRRRKNKCGLLTLIKVVSHRYYEFWFKVLCFSSHRIGHKGLIKTPISTPITYLQGQKRIDINPSALQIGPTRQIWAIAVLLPLAICGEMWYILSDIGTKLLLKTSFICSSQNEIQTWINGTSFIRKTYLLTPKSLTVRTINPEDKFEAERKQFIWTHTRPFFNKCTSDISVKFCSQEICFWEIESSKEILKKKLKRCGNALQMYRLLSVYVVCVNYTHQIMQESHIPPESGACVHVWAIILRLSIKEWSQW